MRDASWKRNPLPPCPMLCRTLQLQEHIPIPDLYIYLFLLLLLQLQQRQELLHAYINAWYLDDGALAGPGFAVLRALEVLGADGKPNGLILNPTDQS